MLFDQLAGFRRLSTWVKKYDAKYTKYCMEATGLYGVPLAEYLVEQNQFISVVNPVKIKYFARSGLVRNKTDKLDAKMIALYASCSELKEFVPRTQEHKEMREWVRLREQLKKDMTSLKMQAQTTNSSQVKLAYKQTISEQEDKKNNKHLKPFIERLEKNNKTKKTIIGGLMKKMAHIIFAILKYKTPYNGALV